MLCYVLSNEAHTSTGAQNTPSDPTTLLGVQKPDVMSAELSLGNSEALTQQLEQYQIFHPLLALLVWHQ